MILYVQFAAGHRYVPLRDCGIDVAVFAIAFAGNGGQFHIFVGVHSTAAEQLTFVPHPVPLHVQLQGPGHETPAFGDCVPAAHSPVVFTAVALAKDQPFATPHCPFTCNGNHLVEKQLAVVHQFAPLQVQVQGHIPATTDAVPVKHKLDAGGELGAIICIVPWYAPHTQCTGTGFWINAWHIGLFGVPEHCHVLDVAVVVTLMTDHAEHKLVVGVDAKVHPFELPHAPATGTTIVALHIGLFGAPEHCHVLDVAVVVMLITDQAAHKLVIGAEGNTPPFDAPQTPGGILGPSYGTIHVVFGDAHIHDAHPLVFVHHPCPFSRFTQLAIEVVPGLQ
jgi:hypothetical protein